jgi:two-component system cell cycle sensor histidine kinase/response regulator CckA
MNKRKRVVPAPQTAASRNPRISDSQVLRLAGEFSQIVWRCNADGSRVVAPTWSILTGQTEAELQNGGWQVRIHPDDRAQLAGAWKRALDDGSDLDAEFRVLLRGGIYEWYRARGEAQRNRRGQVRSWIGMVVNIDEQKRAERSLREQAERLQLVIEAARVGTLDWDLEDDEIHVDRGSRDLLGVPPETHVTIDLLESLVHADDWTNVKAAIEAALNPASGATMDVVFRVTPNGETRWIGVRGRVCFTDDADGCRGVRLLGVLTDLTSEMGELEDRAWLAAIVSSSNDAIIVLTPDGIVTHWNAAAERIYGYSSAEMMGAGIFRIVPPDLADEVAAFLESAKLDADVTNVVTERLAKDGRRLIVTVTLSAIRDRQGALIGVSAIERDITADHLRDEQLREAKQLEGVGQLAAGIAHDMNNILTAMMAGVHLVIQNSELTPRARGRLVQVRDECFRAAGVVRELLAFGRKQVVMPQPCRPNEIVREAQPTLRRLLGEDVELRLELEADRGVYVDRSQLRQVIVSLVAHARDSMIAGGAVTVATSDHFYAEERPPSRVVISVTHDGPILDDETRSRMFEPYFTTREMGPGTGTGLGLSAVYGIVAQFGGTIVVHSTADAGTTYAISLPSIQTPKVNQPAPVAVTVDLGGDETILLVEDEHVLRDQVAEALRQFGYCVLEAENGYDALTVLERHDAPVHLVLSDVVMPAMTGTALVAQLRQWQPTLRVLFITGYSEEAVERYGVMVSNTELLLKPFPIEELVARVRSVLDGPRVPQPAG